jgi:hypothetical protein
MLTADRGRWAARLRRAQRAVQAAEQRRDDAVRHALEHGVGVRGVAAVLGIDKATVSRRYRQRDAQ